jgi:drug/metabolite transporter (DMT)-like permease
MWSGIVLVVCASALWATVVLSPLMLPDSSALQITYGRYIVLGVLSFALVLLTPENRRIRLTREHLLILGKLALFGNVGYFALLVMGIRLWGVTATALILGLLPVTIAIVGRKAGEGPSLKQLALPLTLLCGGVVLMNATAFSGGAGNDASSTLLGLICTVAALISWTWYAIANSRFLLATPGIDSLSWSSYCGVANGLFGVALWLFDSLWLQQYQSVRAVDLYFWSVSALLTVCGSWLAVMLWNLAARRLSVSAAGQLLVCETLFAVMFGALWQEKWPAQMELLAGGVMLVGVIWAMAIHRASLRRTAGKETAVTVG